MAETRRLARRLRERARGRGARAKLAAASQIGSPHESDLLPATGAELKRLGIRPHEVPSTAALRPAPSPNTCRQDSAQSSRGARAQGPDAATGDWRYRVGAEGRISHLKRRYGLRRSRLKGHQGAQTWTAWGIPAYNVDTLAIRTT